MWITLEKEGNEVPGHFVVQISLTKDQFFTMLLYDEVIIRSFRGIPPSDIYGPATIQPSSQPAQS